MDILAWFKLEVIVALAGAVGIITQLIKMIPVDFTSNWPKVIAWVVSAVVVGAIGYYEGADIATMVPVAIAVALVSHGLYDVIAGLYSQIRLKLAK